MRPAKSNKHGSKKMVPTKGQRGRSGAKTSTSCSHDASCRHRRKPPKGTPNPPAKPETKPCTKVFRRGQLVEIVPPVAKLCGQFHTVQHVARATTADGFVLEQKPFPLVWPDTDRFGKPFMQAFAGLETEITSSLEDLGHEVVLTGDRPGRLPEPEWRKLPGNLVGDRRLLRFVQEQERGIIWYRESDVDVAWLIAQIALAYPKEKIVVMATRQMDAEVLAKRLRRHMSGVSLATVHHHPAEAHRVVVVTPSGLGQNGVCARERTICICLNPAEVFNVRKDSYCNQDLLDLDEAKHLDVDRSKEFYGGMEWLPVLKTRLYGLLREDQLLAPQQMDLVRALFGSQRLFIPRHGYRELPVSVKTWQFHGGKRSGEHNSTPELKRELIWRDSLRNRLIAGLARAITLEDYMTLGKKFPDLVAGLAPRLGGRVAVLVENVEHAAQLHEWLPGWPIVADKVSGGRKLPAKAWAAVKAGSQRCAQRNDDVIVTTSAFGKIGSVDVLIRADAGVALPAILSEFFVAADGIPTGLTIVDVDDRHHAHLRRRAEWRKNAYLERGWEVDGQRADPDPDDRPPSTLHRDRQQITTVSYLRHRRGDPKMPAAAAAYQHRQKKREREVAQARNTVTLAEIADHEFLLGCFKQLRSQGGWGTGLDGVTFSSLSPGEWAAVFRKVSRAIVKARYKPQRPRQVPIPKPGTTEKRILSIRSVCDRTVASALHRKLTPHLDKLFMDGSWGFRPGRGTWEMLAHLKKTVEQTGRCVLAIEDVRKAFDNVRVTDLITAHAKAREDLAKRQGQSAVKINESVLKLIAMIARDTSQDRTLGIDQGNNYCPAALNDVLHYFLDLPFSAAVKHPYWYRYADNLAYLCRDEAEGQQMLQMAQGLLRQAGLKLKGNGGVTDLRKKPAELLGFQLRVRAGKVVLTLSDLAWENLALHLAEAHNAADPAATTREVTRGWTNAFGPAFENVGAIVSRVCHTAAQLGFLELDRDQLDAAAQQARERWEKMLDRQGTVVSLLS